MTVSLILTRVRGHSRLCIWKKCNLLSFYPFLVISIKFGSHPNLRETMFPILYHYVFHSETEERAQAAEERAIQAETDLKQALEKIRALERTASRASSTPTGSQTPADRPVSTSMSKRPTSQASTTQPHSPQPPRTPSQLSSRPSTRTSTKKK